ncbi:MAG: UvrD-helicase domain-containing protein, partial [Bacteroidota bacterium]
MVIEPEELLDKPVVIYKSSAGSGKTFTLTKEYLKMALASPQAYQRILAVTFTNKATDEMKTRILDVLKSLAAGEATDMGDLLREELTLSQADLQERAEIVLKEILHHYGRFSVVTIDSFFHQVIRSFAREMGLQGTFTIELDIDKVLQEVIDHMLADVGLEEKRTLRRWLTQFAEERVEEGKSWDFRSEITSLARETLKDVYKLRSQEVLQLSREEGFFSSFLDRLRIAGLGFENKCRKHCLQALDRMKPYGGPSAYKRKLSGPAGLFVKILDGEFVVSDTRRKAAEDGTLWWTKDQAKDLAFVKHVEEEIMPIYRSLIKVIDQEWITYQSLKEVQRYFYTFGILAEINDKLQQYREDNDVMLIADLPDFLRLIIDESDTPYIYEKVGS